MSPMTPEELAALTVTPYGQIRHKLRTGDVVFCSGRYVFSRLIARATGSPITHAGIVLVVPELGRVLVLEAVENFGVRLAPLSRMVRSYRGVVLVARTHAVGDVHRAAGWALDHLAEPYSYATIAALAWRIATRRGTRGDDPDRLGWICSEFAARWLSLAGVAIRPRRERLVAPSDLWGYESLSLFARLR